ncbi:hypothetical protein F4777DRAFT_76277 [Nemania sp. FL0916]|nr:hypothetical protein F4777DRAFT_76277 [Nemania sp. FL0916]
MLKTQGIGRVRGVTCVFCYWLLHEFSDRGMSRLAANRRRCDVTLATSRCTDARKESSGGFSTRCQSNRYRESREFYLGRAPSITFSLISPLDSFRRSVAPAAVSPSPRCYRQGTATLLHSIHCSHQPRVVQAKRAALMTDQKNPRDRIESLIIVRIKDSSGSSPGRRLGPQCGSKESDALCSRLSTTNIPVHYAETPPHRHIAETAQPLTAWVDVA